MENLGKKAIDKITGFTGTIIGKCFYLYGCSQYGIAPTVNSEGKRQDIEWFDEGRISVIGDGVKPEDVRAEKDGCEYREHP